MMEKVLYNHHFFWQYSMKKKLLQLQFLSLFWTFLGVLGELWLPYLLLLCNHHLYLQCKAWAKIWWLICSHTEREIKCKHYSVIYRFADFQFAIWMSVCDTDILSLFGNLSGRRWSLTHFLTGYFGNNHCMIEYNYRFSVFVSKENRKGMFLLKLGHRKNTWLGAQIAVMFLQFSSLTWCTYLNQNPSDLAVFCWLGRPIWCTNTWLEEADNKNWSM